jgi:4-amino-4-deoxy-L-arabinose transferase-like glycosyltransferase
MTVKKSPSRLFRAGTAAALLVALFLIHLVIHIGFSPAYQPLSTDSGVFAYCGARMLSGNVLYSACWDNKPPMVYLINAFIVALGGQNPWAIWWFQLLWTTASSAVIIALARRVWRGWIPAVVSGMLFIGTALTAAYYAGGNLTENYLLLPLALTASALYASLNGGQVRWMAALGALTAFAVLLKPTYFGMGVAAGLTVILFDFSNRKFRHGIKNLAMYTLGLVLPLALTALIFWRLGALDDLWFAVFRHNAGYVQSGFSSLTLKNTLHRLFIEQPLASLYWIALTSVGIYGLMKFFLNRGQTGTPRADANAWWLGGLLLALPLQMASIALSGKNFGHYFLEIIPTLALLASAGPAMLMASPHRPSPRIAIRVGLGVVLLGFIAVWGKGLDAKGLVNLERLSSTIHSPNLWDYKLNDLEQYIQDNSRPDQSVLVWATHVDFNFVTGRHSPTRYIFPLHVLTETMNGPTGFTELLDELSQDPPQLIIQQVVSSANLPSFTASEENLCPDCSDAARSGLQDMQNYIYANYRYATQIYDWQVFVRR